MDNEELTINDEKIVLHESGFAIPITEEDWLANYSNIETYEEYRTLKLAREAELVKEFLENR